MTVQPSKYIQQFLPAIQSYAVKAVRVVELGIGEGNGATIAIRKALEGRKAVSGTAWVSVDSQANALSSLNMPEEDSTQASLSLEQAIEEVDSPTAQQIGPLHE
jgi:hypothetical protein